MAGHIRVQPTTIHWRFKNQAKIHQLTYYTATAPAYDADAAELNADVAEALAEYARACEAGTAVRVLEPVRGRGKP